MRTGSLKHTAWSYFIQALEEEAKDMIEVQENDESIYIEQL